MVYVPWRATLQVLHQGLIAVAPAPRLDGRGSQHACIRAVVPDGRGEAHIDAAEDVAPVPAVAPPGSSTSACRWCGWPSSHLPVPAAAVDDEVAVVLDERIGARVAPEVG